MSRKKPRNFDRRKKSSGRSRPGRVLFAIIILTIALSIFSGAAWLIIKKGFEQSVFFTVDKVDIEGCRYVSSKKVLALTGLDVKSNMWAIQTSELAAKLEKQNWIEKAEIDKDWPSRIRIKIRERTPQALMSRNEELFYLDDNGEIFAPVLPENDRDFPVISIADNLEEKTVENERYISSALGFLRLAAEGNPDLPKQNISEIHFSETGLVMFLVDYPFPVYLGKNDINQKYGRLSKVLSWLYSRKKIADTKYIDMDYLTVDKEGRRQRGKDVMVVFKES